MFFFLQVDKTTFRNVASYDFIGTSARLFCFGSSWMWFHFDFITYISYFSNVFLHFSPNLLDCLRLYSYPNCTGDKFDHLFSYFSPSVVSCTLLNRVKCESNRKFYFVFRMGHYHFLLHSFSLCGCIVKDQHFQRGVVP